MRRRPSPRSPLIAAEPRAWVRVGFKPEISRDHFRSLLGKPEIEEALNFISVEPGDVVYVPAGTMHSIGPGLCLCEIQQYSDLTYRIYDYERVGLDGHKRALHIEQALAAMRLRTPEAGRIVAGPIDPACGNRQLLISGSYFAMEKYDISEVLNVPVDPSHFDLLVFCLGKGTLSAGKGQMEYVKGDAFLIPASSGQTEIRPFERTELLRVYVPR